MTWGPVSLPSKSLPWLWASQSGQDTQPHPCLLTEKIWGALSIWAPLLPCPQEQLCLTTGTLGCGVRCPVDIEKITNSSGDCVR